MPITKSAKKRLRQNRKNRSVNLVYKRRMKEVVKKIEDLVSGGKKKEAEKLLPAAYKVVDKAAKSGVIKQNTAARKKSRLAKFFS